MSHCASCSRVTNEPTNKDAVTSNGVLWCAHCAKITETPEGYLFVPLSSPGRIVEVNRDDPLEAWIDCFEMKPKHRILVKNAKKEIQRAWELWGGDKTTDIAMFQFFGWLTRHRPYFLTFRSKGDPWQTVHTWLIQYESSAR